MIRLWLEVFNPSYTTQVADGVVELVSATVSRVLDGAGSVSVMTTPLHRDFTARPITMLTVKRVCEVWWQEEPRAPRLVATFVIEAVDYAHQSGGISMKVSGADVMSLLLNYTTGLALSYDNMSNATISDALVTLAGWTITFNGSVGNATVRFDGADVLKSLQTLAEHTGNHFRLTDTHKQLEWGALGDDSGYRLLKIEGDKPSPSRDSSVIPLVSIDVKDDSSELVNKIYPLSAGNGDGRGDLQKSNKSSPYTIQNETINSRTHYYIEDATSVAAYGEIAKVLNFSKIAPIGTSSTSRQRTANQLYDAAAKWLARHKDPFQEIRVRVAQQRVNFTVGDMVRVEHVDMVNVGGSPVVLKDINDLYWVMSVRESYGASGETATLELASVDRTQGDIGKQMVQAVGGIDVQETGYKATYNIWTDGPFSDYINSGQDAVFEFTIPDDVLSVENVTLVLHTFSDRQSYVPSVPLYVTSSSFTEPVTKYYPYDMDIDVNGSSIATGVAASDTTQISGNEYDITDEVVDEGDDGRGTHTITIDTGGTGGGLVVVGILIRGLIIPGKVT